jgi:hypothetical protein
MEARASKDEAVWLLYLSWTEGFITGAMNSTPHGYKQTDGSGIAAQMDVYCREKPMDSLLDASIDVLVKLRQ